MWKVVCLSLIIGGIMVSLLVSVAIEHIANRNLDFADLCVRCDERGVRSSGIDHDSRRIASLDFTKTHGEPRLVETLESRYPFRSGTLVVPRSVAEEDVQQARRMHHIRQFQVSDGQEYSP